MKSPTQIPTTRLVLCVAMPWQGTEMNTAGLIQHCSHVCSPGECMCAQTSPKSMGNGEGWKGTVNPGIWSMVLCVVLQIQLRESACKANPCNCGTPWIQPWEKPQHSVTLLWPCAAAGELLWEPRGAGELLSAAKCPFCSVSAQSDTAQPQAAALLRLTDFV